LRHAKVWNKAGFAVDSNAQAEEEEEKEKGELSEDDNNEEETKAREDTKNDNAQADKNAAPQSPKFAPMLVVAAIAPVMAQAGKAYVQYLDTLLEQGDSLVPGMGPLQMLPLAEAVVTRKDDASLNDRERRHIQAVDCMLRYDYETALLIYSKILRMCPGDVLALSMAMDLANVLGDKDMAFR
jgi:hypothetical protein